MVELGLTAGFVTTKITRHPQVACFSGRLNLMRDNNVCPNLSSLWLVSHRFIMMILSQKVNGFPYQVAHRLYHPWTNKHRGSSSQIWLNTIYSSNHEPGVFRAEWRLSCPWWFRIPQRRPSNLVYRVVFAISFTCWISWVSTPAFHHKGGAPELCFLFFWFIIPMD